MDSGLDGPLSWSSFHAAHSRRGRPTCSKIDIHHRAHLFPRRQSLRGRWPPPAQLVEVDVDHRRGEQGQHLGDQQAADDREAQRLAELRAGAVRQDHRHAAQRAAAVVIRIGRKRCGEACGPPPRR